MSTGQFSESPRPTFGDVRCPFCDVRVSPGAERCWLCEENLKGVQLATAPAARPASDDETVPEVYPAAGPRRGDKAGYAVFGVLALVLCVGLALSAPGLLILLAILVTPAFIRTAVTAPHGGGSPAGGFVTFHTSIGVVAIVGLASFAAFFATCFAVCLGGIALSDMGVQSGRGGEWIMLPSVVGGLAAGIFVAFRLFRRLWSRRS